MVEYLQIGKIVNTFGVKGEVKAIPLTDDVSRFDLLKEVYVEQDNQLKSYKIDKVKYQSAFVMLKFQGVDDIETAEKLKNCFIKVHRSRAVQLPKDSFFVCDLIGLKVYDEKEQYLGDLINVLQTGANDVYEVENQGKRIYIPALKAVVKSIDIQNAKISVELPRGLIDDEV